MRRKRLTAGVIVVVGAGGAIFWHARSEKSAPPPAVVATVAADDGPVTVTVGATGAIRPATTRNLSFSLTGMVATVGVQVGAAVKAGAVLATLNPAGAIITVTNAQAALAAAKDRLTAAKATVVTKSAARTTPTGVGQLASAASMQGKNGDDKLAIDTEARGAELSASAVHHDSILSAWQQVNQAQAAMSAAKATLTGTTIQAPITGTVMSIAGKVGSQVGQGRTFITVADTHQMQVVADFPEADVSSLAIGQLARVTLGGSTGVQYAAKVVQVDPIGTSAGNLVTYGVRLAFTQAPRDLLVGQSAAVAVTTGHVARTLRIPTTAVHDVDGRTGMVEVHDGGSTAQRTVQVGVRGDLYLQITSGLTEGEVVARFW